MKTKTIATNATINKNAIFENLVTFYHKASFTDNYIFAFVFKGVVYMVKAGSCDFNKGVKLDKASRGAGYSIRFKPNKTDKINLLALGAKVLCSEEFFNELVKNSKYNKGEIIEKLVTEYYGQEWEKDNVPFTEDGDLTINGKAYQIKFEKATFINETQMARMRARG